MPGVLLIECMAQTCGWLVSAVSGFAGLPVLAGVRDAKIRAAVYPGDSLEFEGRVLHSGSGYAIAEGKGRSDKGAVCDARLTYRVIPYPNEEFRSVMRDWARRIDFPLAEFVT
jgi:3-hydroxyacyl-[acyl-carrier-protein] dehydratase